ncbi:MAG: hypothetical protein ABIQ43_02160 [Sphingomonas sp.]
MKRALIAATIFFLGLFAVGFVLGTIRVIFVAPRIGQLAATIAEIPVMLVAAFFTSRWSIRHWQVVRKGAVRWTMGIWFLILLAGFETVLGVTLFGRSIADQWVALAAPAGLIGLSGQLIAAFMSVFVDSREQ